MHATDLLGCLVGIIGIATLFYYLCDRIEAAVVGLIVSGLIVNVLGGYFARFASASPLLRSFADYGVIFLLFAVGVGFSLRRLRLVWRYAFIIGPVQMVSTAAVLVPLLVLIGLSWHAAILTAVLGSMSSTVICMQGLLKERKLDTPEGGIAVGILLFQDLSLLPLMLLLPVLSGTAQGVASCSQVLFGALALIGIFTAGFYGFNMLFDLIAGQRDRHLMRMALILVCLAGAFVTALTGMSPALGAFVAGLALSRTRYSPQARGVIEEFTSTFGMVFFIAVGLILDLRFVMHHLPLIMLCLTVLMSIKALTGMLSVLVLDRSLRTAVVVGLLLAQVGELAFVASQLGVQLGVLSADECQLLTTVAVLSMALTPFLNKLAFRIADLAGIAGARSRHAESEPVHNAGQPMRIVLVGAGPSNHIIGGALSRLNTPEKTVVCVTYIERNHSTAIDLEQRGISVIRGDCRNAAVRDAAKIDEAKLICIAINDPRAEETAVALIRAENPRAMILIRTKYMKDVKLMTGRGADEVVAEEVTAGVVLASRALSRLNLPAMPMGELEELAAGVMQKLSSQHKG